MLNALYAIARPSVCPSHWCIYFPALNVNVSKTAGDTSKITINA